VVREVRVEENSSRNSSESGWQGDNEIHTYYINCDQLSRNPAF